MAEIQLLVTDYSTKSTSSYLYKGQKSSELIESFIYAQGHKPESVDYMIQFGEIQDFRWDEGATVETTVEDNETKTEVTFKPSNATFYCSDAWTAGNPGKGGYRALGPLGNTLKEEIYDEVTNNQMEFLGLVAAIRSRGEAIVIPIYTDSKTALSWLKHRRLKSRIKDPRVARDVKEALDFIDKYPEFCVNIEKWNTKEWGEIPADYGRK